MSPSELRYHIASLAAVFLALGIGILIGTAFVGAPVVDRQTRLIRGLEGSVADLRKETAERQSDEAALRAVLPEILRGKLAGKRAVVIQTGPYTDAANQSADALRLAGATVVERIVLPTDAWRAAGDAAAAPATPGGNSGSSGGDRYATLAETARRLGTLLASGDDGDLTDLRQRGLVTGDITGSVRFAVLVGGAETATGAAAASPDEPWATVLARSVDLPLADALAQHGVTVVGTEPFDAGVSFMHLYQGAGMATVDCIDREVGKLALPFALLGEKAGYGLKPTAERLLPASLEHAGDATESAPPSPNSP